MASTQVNARAHAIQFVTGGRGRSDLHTPRTGMPRAAQGLLTKGVNLEFAWRESSGHYDLGAHGVRTTPECSQARNGATEIYYPLPAGPHLGHLPRSGQSRLSECTRKPPPHRSPRSLPSASCGTPRASVPGDVSRLAKACRAPVRGSGRPSASSQREP